MTSTRYVTIAELKAWFTWPAGTDDDQLEKALVRAEARVDAYCRRTFAASADTVREFSSHDGLVMLDGDLFVSAAHPAAVTVDGQETTAFKWAPANRNPKYALYLDDPPGSDAVVQVTGRWAYSITCPDDVQEAVRRLAVYFHRQRSNPDDSDRLLQDGVGQIRIPPGQPSEVSTILRPYRRTDF